MTSDDEIWRNYVFLAVEFRFDIKKLINGQKHTLSATSVYFSTLFSFFPSLTHHPNFTKFHYLFDPMADTPWSFFTKMSKSMHFRPYNPNITSEMTFNAKKHTYVRFRPKKGPIVFFFLLEGHIVFFFLLPTHVMST